MNCGVVLHFLFFVQEKYDLFLTVKWYHGTAAQKIDSIPKKKNNMLALHVRLKLIFSAVFIK